MSGITWMRETRRLLRAQTWLTGVLAATLAFCWALCTPTEAVTPRATVTADRAVGSGLHFSNPFVSAGVSGQFPSGGNTTSDPQGFDLGDAVIGSSVSRYLTALDGVTPYIFSSTTAGSLGLAVSSTGHVTGSFSLTGTNVPNFTAQVLDAAGVTRTGIFFLNSTSATLHFAIDALPQASVGQDFDTNIPIVGGDTTNTVLSVVAGSVQLNGTAAASLEATGLHLFPDGQIAGRPLVAGTISFTAQAIRNGTHALNRAQTAPDQKFTIQVLGINSIQSVLATQSATISINGRSRDSITLKTYINADGLNNSAFAGKTFTMRLGNQVFTTTLDAGGQSRFGNVKVRLNALGAALTVQVRGVSLANLFDTTLSGSFQTAVLQLALGEDYLGTEAIRFELRSRGSRAQLRYTLGRDIQLGGLFQITGVKAGDFGNSTTAFKINFLLSHVRGFSTTEFGIPQQATVNIGPGFTQSLPLFHGRSRGSFPGIRSVAVNTRTKKGTIATFALPSSQTGVAPASQGKAQTLLLGLNLTTDSLLFFGEGSAVLIPFAGFR